MDLTSRFLCNSAFTASDFSSITSQKHCFCFDSSSSFFLELFLHSSPVAYFVPTDLESSSFSIFLPFHTVHGVLKVRILKWFAIPFPMDHILSELSPMTCPSWVALQGMAHIFIELDKAVVHVISLVVFL